MELSHRRIELAHGISLHLREGGRGLTTTLFLHGWAVPGVVWEPVLDRLPEDQGRVLVPDLRGTGWSDKPAEGYTLEDDVRDVLALIDHLVDEQDLSELALVGHSKGGLIAQRVALERPKLLRKLVLASPVPASGISLDQPTIDYFESLCGHREGASQLITAMLVKQPHAGHLERLVESMASVCLPSLLGGFAAFRNAHFGDQLSSIQTPTEVISGEAEELLSPDLMRAEVVGRISGARLQLLPGTGHYPQLEDADAFTAALVAALA